MSWDIALIYYKNGHAAMVSSFQEGGTYLITKNKTQEAELNITWNYSLFYYHLLSAEKGIKWLNGQQARETIRKLEFAVEMLGTTKDENYWKPTKGNAGYALSILLKWANEHPEAYWSVE